MSQKIRHDQIRTILIEPHVSEKTTLLNQNSGQIAFKVRSDSNKKQVLIPPKFGNGHVVMSDHAVFSYKLDSYHNYSNQFTIRWNDEDAHNIWWPIKNPITSLRDA